MDIVKSQESRTIPVNKILIFSESSNETNIQEYHIWLYSKNSKQYNSQNIRFLRIIGLSHL